IASFDSNIVGEEGNALCTVTRSSPRHHANNIQDLEGFQHPNQNRGNTQRDQKRKGNVTKRLPAGGAIYLRGIVKFFRKSLETCKENADEACGPLPGLDDN